MCFLREYRVTVCNFARPALCGILLLAFAEANPLLSTQQESTTDVLQHVFFHVTR